MSRLADYFIIIGYDNNKQDRNGLGCGKIIQRFPIRDWPDTPFIKGLELFCQPQGWSLSSDLQEPKFFVSVLTDIDCNHHYCAVLCFNEPASLKPVKPTDEEEDNLVISNSNGSLGRPTPLFTHHSIIYAPKCLVLVSSLDYFSTLRDCLGILYAVHMEGYPVRMEKVIGNLMGYIQVPPAGGPQIRFSLGAGDSQSLQPSASNTIPVTRLTIATLFLQLGIRDVMLLFCAALAEHKILFHSKSYCRLTDACHALKSLLYPFKYSHVYIPILPTTLVEVLSTPTPFIMGVHSSIQDDFAELMDVIVADLDGGSIRVPESLALELLPEPYWSKTEQALSLVLHPELLVADNAFPPSNPVKASPIPMLDKELHAVFMRMFAELLQGYRSCLNIIRIHAKPVIVFHKASFLGQRGLVDDRFVVKLLDCMFFTAFVSERGPPWRVGDLWDDLYANIADLNRQEEISSKELRNNIQELAKQLYTIENPNPQPFISKIPKPTEGAFSRINQFEFPKIDAAEVQEIIDAGTSRKVVFPQKPDHPRIIPMGPHISSLQRGRTDVTSSARRLEVMRNCISLIFENKINDARKTFPAVLRALKSKAARLALCTELSHYVSGNKAVLEHQQFDLVVRLMKCALQDDSSVMDENGVAAALLPLSTAFCRKLCTGVIQFAFTCIQEAAVWSNPQFWEAAFYQDVQREIKALYAGHQANLRLNSRSETFMSPHMQLDRMWQDRRASYLNQPEQSSLEIAAEQMRLWNTYDKNKRREFDEQEESILYSQAIHFANQMVYLKVPLDVNCNAYRKFAEKDNISTSITNSVAESDSFDAESGFEDQEQNDAEQGAIKFVSRFVDKVCTEGLVTAEHVKALHQMIPGVVAMHIEMLDAVCKESKRLPRVQKPKIPLPSLVPGEEILFEGLRVYLVCDGREEGLGHLGGPALIPAFGALFLTNYRLVFKGQPTDTLACEHVIVRCMPVASITREKRISGINLDRLNTDGLQIRSNSFQLLKVAFDEEVSPESVESIRKMINRLRHPQAIHHLFAFSGHQTIPQTPNRREKDKPGYGTLRGFAKKTLMKTAKVAGLKSGKGNKRHKYVFPENSHRSFSAGPMTLPTGLSLADEELQDDDLSGCKLVRVTSPVSRSSEQLDSSGRLSPIVDELEVSGVSNGSAGHLPIITRDVDSKTLEKLTERSYYKDFQRLGLGQLSISSSSPTRADFRITSCNSNYQLCRSYPALISVPGGVTDESLHKLSRLYHQQRIPIVTWRHAQSRSLLCRGAGFHSKGVISMLKGPQAGGGATNEMSHSIEQEKYFAAITSLLPYTGSDFNPLTDASPSMDSFLNNSTCLSPHDQYPSTYHTPEISRKTSPFVKAMNTLRRSGFKSSDRSGSLRPLKIKHSHLRAASNLDSNARLPYSLTSSARLSVDASETSSEISQNYNVAALYVFGERAQIKGVKQDAFARTEFVPVDYPEVRQLKSSFKKLMRACVPSNPSADQEQTFYRAIENSEWLHHLSSLLQCSGNIVNLIHGFKASVMILLEDGWEFTAQVSSLAQLCLDPYYRTIEGFRVLIEKEWLAFGHRFLHRANLLQGGQTGAFAPYFLQFLDAVHQIQRQFPLAFEFNDYYLRFLAYHSTSARFRTFLSNCELDRAQMGIMTEEDKRGSLSRHHNALEIAQEDDIFPSGPRIMTSSQYLGQSVFDYIEKLSSRSTTFYNFMFVQGRTGESEQVLRPLYDISSIVLWGYLVEEELKHGPSYNPEIRSLDKQHEEEEAAAEGTHSTSKRRIVIKGYDCLSDVQPDVFSAKLDELRHLEMELAHLPQNWVSHWDKLEVPPMEQLGRQVSMTTQMVRHHGRSVHKRNTLEMLFKAKATGISDSPQNCYSHPHRFEKYNYTTPSHCDHCSSVLWGPLKTGMRCVDCGYNCHEKCIEQVPKNCTQYKSGREVGTNMQNTNKPCNQDTTSVGSGVTSHQASHPYYEFSSNVAENRTHEGYLWKRGVLLKNWKQRWFVLDTMKHQLRYYDCMEDPHSKGIIELSDVVSVCPSGPSPGAPKKVDDRAFFDLQTRRRLYNFCASDGTSSQEWIEKIQSCLQ